MRRTLVPESSLAMEPKRHKGIDTHHRPLLPPWPAPSKRSLWGAFSLAFSLELMLRVPARFTRSEQPLGHVGNEQVPVGLDLPLDGRPALFLGHPDPKPRRRLDPLAQQGAGRGFNETVARTRHRLPA